MSGRSTPQLRNFAGLLLAREAEGMRTAEVKSLGMFLVWEKLPAVARPADRPRRFRALVLTGAEVP